MVIGLVLLTDGASCDKGIDERGESRPPEVSFQECFGAEVSCMSSSGGVMYGTDDGLPFMWGNVHMTFEVQVAIGHVPVIHGGTGEQGGSFF